MARRDPRRCRIDRLAGLGDSAVDSAVRSAGRRGDPRGRERAGTRVVHRRPRRGRRSRRRRRRRARRDCAVLRIDRPPHRRAGGSRRRFRRPPSRRRRRTSAGSVGRGTRSTTRWIRPAFTRTRRWSSRAASTTRRPAARRPASPASPAPDPKPERRTSFSPTPNGSSTTPWPRVTVKHPGWTQKSPAPNRRWRPHARPQSRTPTAASVHAGSPCTTTRWRARAHSYCGRSRSHSSYC